MVINFGFHLDTGFSRGHWQGIGIIAEKGRSLGIDLDDVVLIPVAAAQALFNTESLFRIFAEARGRSALDEGEAAIRSMLTQRHDGDEDFTIIGQDWGGAIA